jgi:hypothetical protein
MQSKQLKPALALLGHAMPHPLAVKSNMAMLAHKFFDDRKNTFLKKAALRGGAAWRARV